ncbi:DNA primase protein [Marine Group I thaumarchaeote SCGC AAA799-B03]|uniref:DNA primase protein n=1 Tax=Marine Group I thaumarchaeote SCGC AAA799-B03 TaxID=1502289 RepID=A0A087S6Y1_9ARCH|nr:DNA primase protein [Marine Group I thaumarchaeote SCGC AAA799-B03]
MNQQIVPILKELGLNVIPLKPKSKTPNISWKQYQNEQYLEEIPDECNIGIVCGKISKNLVVLDIDILDESLLDKVLPNAKKRTLVVQTGSGKFHIYTRVLNLPKSCKLENELGRIEIKSEGTYVVGISSIHPDTGKEYKVISETSEIVQIDFKEIQNNLKQIGFDSENKHQLIKKVERDGVLEGSRNDSMFNLSRKFLSEYDEPTAWAYLQTVNEKNSPPLGLQELKITFDSAKDYPYVSNVVQENSSSELFDLANSQIKKIVISQNNSSEVYAIIENNDHLETLNLSSRRAIHWLNNISHKQNTTSKIHSDDFYKNILNAIISKAQMEETCKEKVYSRTAFLGDVLYYDLCTPDWKIVKITKNDIDIIPFSESTPIFRRTQSGYAQINPIFEESDSLEKIANLLRIKDVQLFKVHLVCMFLESIPVPIMFFDGEAGSMKTTTTASIKRIIDPNGINNEDNCNSISTRNDDLIIQLNNRYVSAFDNVTKISQGMSDVLCRAITGSGNVKRELYTNSEETILNFRRKIILNGIVPSVDYPDLQDRMISYDRIPLQNNQRLTDKEFQERFNRLLPSAIGQIFKTIQKSLIHYGEVKQDVKPKTRLADFEIWGETISRELGYEPNSFLETFYEKQKQTSIASIDSQPLVETILRLMDDKTEYENTMSNCYKTLVAKATELDIDTKSQYVRFPKASNQVSKQLVTLKPILRKIGIIVEIYTYTKNDKKYIKNNTIVKFTKLGIEPSPASPPSPQSIVNSA